MRIKSCIVGAQLPTGSCSWPNKYLFRTRFQPDTRSATVDCSATMPNVSSSTYSNKYNNITYRTHIYL